jgi:hypothetical protein
LLAHDGDRWVLQGVRDDVLSLLAVRGAWAVLAPEGVLTLGAVETRTRPRPVAEVPGAPGAASGSGAGSVAPGTP